jgi:predicted transcriptional regulator
VILLPLYPQYAKDIMAGKKTVEFRKSNVPRNVTHVVVYATAPERKMLGYVSVKRTVTASPPALWQRFGRGGRVTQKDFETYYRGADLGVAIIVDRVFRFARTLSVDLNGALHPIPQSFKYVTPCQWRRFRLRKLEAITIAARRRRGT